MAVVSAVIISLAAVTSMSDTPRAAAETTAASHVTVDLRGAALPLGTGPAQSAISSLSTAQVLDVLT
jgi:hypothetical protein